jgi:hypothetical protein
MSKQSKPDLSQVINKDALKDILSDDVVPTTTRDGSSVTGQKSIDDVRAGTAKLTDEDAAEMEQEVQNIPAPAQAPASIQLTPDSLMAMMGQFAATLGEVLARKLNGAAGVEGVSEIPEMSKSIDEVREITARPSQRFFFVAETLNYPALMKRNAGPLRRFRGLPLDRMQDEGIPTPEARR